MSVEARRQQLKSIYSSQKERRRIRQDINGKPGIASFLGLLEQLKSEKYESSMRLRGGSRLSYLEQNDRDDLHRERNQNCGAILQHANELMIKYDLQYIEYLDQGDISHACMALIEKMKTLILYRQTYAELQLYERDSLVLLALPLNEAAVKAGLYAQYEEILTRTKLVTPDRTKRFKLFTVKQDHRFSPVYSSSEELSSSDEPASGGSPESMESDEGEMRVYFQRDFPLVGLAQRGVAPDGSGDQPPTYDSHHEFRDRSVAGSELEVQSDLFSRTGTTSPDSEQEDQLVAVQEFSL
jgi:hypothetical protein